MLQLEIADNFFVHFNSEDSIQNSIQETEIPSIQIESSRFFVSPTEANLTDNIETLSVDNFETLSVDHSETASIKNVETMSSNNVDQISVDNVETISVYETPSRKISTETFVGKISIDDDSISSVSTIDYQPCVITTAEIHRQIDDTEKNHRHVGKIHRHVDVDDTESEFSEAGTTESYSDDDDERHNSIHSIPSSLTRYINKYQPR
jgi:hypothetical protein